jgi:hypothetical protein
MEKDDDDDDDDDKITLNQNSILTITECQDCQN